MILTDLLAGAIGPDEPVLADFVATMAESFIVQHALTAAKGSTDLYFGKNHDQSMMAHIFNGLFPTMRLLALADRFRDEPWLSATGQRLYILGYAMHDLNKLRRLRRELDTSSQENIRENLALLTTELERVNVAAFFPEYKLYLEDILFLVVNTQLMGGANLSVYQFPNIRHDEQELLRARDLCTYSDNLAFLVKSPADVLYGDGATKLAQILRMVSSNRFRLVYHQFSDVRGLLTGVINNGIKDLIAPQPEQEDAIGPLVPYLYFTKGVVYLQTERQISIDLSPAQVWTAVEKRLREECLAHIDESAPGVSFNIKSNLKYPGYFEDLLDPLEFADLLVKACLRTRANVTSSTRDSMQALAASQKMPPGASLDYPADDARIAIIGRFLLNFDKLIIERVNQVPTRAALTHLLHTSFGLADAWPLADKIPSSGGLDYRYFWLGAQFVTQHPGLAAEGEEEGSLKAFLTAFVSAAAPLFVPGLQANWQGTLLPQLRRYVEANLSFGGFDAARPVPPDFVATFESYVAAKQGRQAKLPCTICSSGYLVDRKQTDAEVLFQPWVYKNRLPLNASENAGGVCAICLLEMMLRQLKQQGELRLTGKDFEEIQLKFFYLYPNYFFTTETATLVRQLTGGLRDFNIHTANRALADTPLDPADYLGLEMFALPDPVSDEHPPRTYYRMDFAEHDTQSLIFFGHKALGKSPTASETWAVPALLSLMLPLALGCKVVLADSYLPLFAGGEDFKETVVLDAPHPFLSYLLPSDPPDVSHIPEAQRVGRELVPTPAGRVRIDKVLDKLRVLTRVYCINYDTYGEPRDPGWNMLGRVARGVRSDPLNVFHYLGMQARAAKVQSLMDSYWPKQSERYMRAYCDIWNGLKDVIGGQNPMEIIAGLVDRYAKFYSPNFRSASIVRPVEIAAKLLLSYPHGANRSVEEQQDASRDIQWMLRGELARWLERLRHGEGAGRARFYGKAISEYEDPALADFARFFYETVYISYCRGEGGLLRSRLNNIKSGCEAYYSANRTRWGKRTEENDATEEESTEMPEQTGINP